MSTGKVDNEYVDDLKAKLIQARQEIRELMEQIKQLQDKQVIKYSYLLLSLSPPPHYLTCTNCTIASDKAFFFFFFFFLTKT